MRPSRPFVRLILGLIAIVIFWQMYNGIAKELKKLTLADVAFYWPPSWGLAIASLLVLIAAQLLHAALWRMIAIDLGSPAPGLRSTLHIYFVSSLGRYVPGRVLQIAGLAVLAARHGMAAGRAAAASVIAQIAFLGTGLLILGGTLPAWPADALQHTVFRSIPNPIWIGVLLVAAAILFIWLLSGQLGASLRTSLTRRAGPRFGGSVGTAFSLLDNLTFGRGIKWGTGYAVSWLILGAAFKLYATSFGATLSFPVACGIVGGAYLLGYIMFFVPAGVGAREGAMLALLSAFMPLGQASLIAATSRVWFTVAEMLPLALIPFAGRPTPPVTIVEEEV